MRRAKLGDVYAVKVPNGYKIIQWAYDIERYGTFIRVFDGLYDAIPEDVAQIVAGSHSYITDLFVGRAYRIGLLEWLGNHPVPEKYPFPRFMAEYHFDQHHQLYEIAIMKTILDTTLPQRMRFPVTSIAELPEPYCNAEMLTTRFAPDMLLYLFDNGFTLEKPDIQHPVIHWGPDWREHYQVYIDIVIDALSKDPKSKSILKRYLS